MTVQTITAAAKIDWPDEAHYGPPAHPGAAHAYAKGWQAGYNQAILDLAYGLLKKMHDDLAATLERLAP